MKPSGPPGEEGTKPLDEKEIAFPSPFLSGSALVGWLVS